MSTLIVSVWVGNNVKFVFEVFLITISNLQGDCGGEGEGAGGGEGEGAGGGEGEGEAVSI